MVGCQILPSTLPGAEHQNLRNFLPSHATAAANLSFLDALYSPPPKTSPSDDKVKKLPRKEVKPGELTPEELVAQKAKWNRI